MPKGDSVPELLLRELIHLANDGQSFLCRSATDFGAEAAEFCAVVGKEGVLADVEFDEADVEDEEVVVSFLLVFVVPEDSSDEAGPSVGVVFVVLFQGR